METPEILVNHPDIERVGKLGIRAKHSLKKGTLIPFEALLFMTDSLYIAPDHPMLDKKNFTLEQRREKWEEYKKASQDNACVGWEQSHHDHSDRVLLKDIHVQQPNEDEKTNTTHTSDAMLFRYTGTEQLARIWVQDVLNDVKNEPISPLLYRCVQKTLPIREIILSLLTPEEMFKFMEESAGCIKTAFLNLFNQTEYGDRAAECAERASQCFSKYQTANSEILHRTFDNMTVEQMTELVKKRAEGLTEFKIPVDLTQNNLNEYDEYEEEGDDDDGDDDEEYEIESETPDFESEASDEEQIDEKTQNE